MTTHFSGTKKKTVLEQENIDFSASKKSLSINVTRRPLTTHIFALVTRSSCLDLVTSEPTVDVNLFFTKSR